MNTFIGWGRGYSNESLLGKSCFLVRGAGFYSEPASLNYIPIMYNLILTPSFSIRRRKHVMIPERQRYTLRRHVESPTIFYLRPVHRIYWITSYDKELRNLWNDIRIEPSFLSVWFLSNMKDRFKKKNKSVGNTFLQIL